MTGIWAAVNILAFFLFAADKAKAVSGAYRIPENVLFAVCAAGGGLGGYLGMKLFRHKTMKPEFSRNIPRFAVAGAVIGILTAAADIFL